MSIRRTAAVLDLCAAAGITGRDADTAVTAYVRRGELTPLELADLPTCTPEERSAYLSLIYGSDAARVATLVYEESLRD